VLRLARSSRLVPSLLLLAACGSRTALEVDVASDAGPRSASCVAAPHPTVLVSLLARGMEGAASYAFTGDASRLYTFVWGADSQTTHVLSVDPCTGASVVLGDATAYSSPLAADGSGVYFETSPDRGQTFDLVRSDPLGARSSVVSTYSLYLTGLTVFGGRGYAVTGSTALEVLALDGSGPSTLVSSPVADRVRVWWDGAAVDDAYVYFYGSNGLERVPVRGGPTTTLFPDGGASACGGSSAAADPLVVADDANVYLSGAHGLRRVAKDGSSTSAYPGTESSRCGPLAIDDAYLYFADRTAVRRVAKTGGAVEALANANDAGGIVVTANSLYWLDYVRAVMKLDKP
jgi:hypothetical protein